MSSYSKPNKILVVDDEPLLQTLITRNFKELISQGTISLVFANNGVEALKMLESDKEIGVILTDINMPEMDGLTLLSQLAKESKIYQTIVVSAYGDMHNLRIAMNRGASDFVTKPIDFTDLEKTLIKTIDQYHFMLQGAVAKQLNIEMNKELNIAREIQQEFIPRDFLSLQPKDAIDVYGEMTSAKEVGGDFFDCMKISENQVSCIIADVSGKGVPAALFMVRAQTIFHCIATQGDSPYGCLLKMHELLSYRNTSCMFLTCFYLTLDSKTGEVRYCNAGHLAPLLISSDGRVELLPCHTGIALGVDVDIPHKSILEEGVVYLKPQETLLLYTDGVIEAQNLDSKFYGIDRLKEFLQSHASLSVKKLVTELKEDLMRFYVSCEQYDDITILAIRYMGAPSASLS